VEFASFYRTLGAEGDDRRGVAANLPVEDAEIAAFARKAFERQGIKIMTATKVVKLDRQADA